MPGGGCRPDHCVAEREREREREREKNEQQIATKFRVKTEPIWGGKIVVSDNPPCKSIVRLDSYCHHHQGLFSQSPGHLLLQEISLTGRCGPHSLTHFSLLGQTHSLPVS